jgi:hypothetical protein
MNSDPAADPKFEIGHVLFVDIVGYSKLLIGEQSELIRQLKTHFAKRAALANFCQSVLMQWTVSLTLRSTEFRQLWLSQVTAHLGSAAR